MSSIDERVVILTFDNKQFEKNVQTSVQSLDNLKRGLNLESSAKNLSQLQAVGKSFSLGGIGSSVDFVASRFTNLGIVGMEVIRNLTSSAVDLGKKLLTAIPTQIIEGGKKRALNFEQANFQLEGLLGKLPDGAQKIEEIMTAANNAVSGTAYGLDEAAKVASQLVASGLQDGEKMEFVLKGISGTAAMTGSSYAEIGDIFTTVAGNGKLMTEQLRMFSHRGLNVAAELATQLGYTEEEIRQMVTDGEISFEMFSEAMSAAFGEHAQKANKTFTGSLSNVKSALSRLGAKVAMPSLEHLRDLFNVIRPLIDTVSAALDPLIEKLNNGIGKAADFAVKGFTTLYLALGGSAEKLKEQTEYVSDSAKATIDGAISRYEKIAPFFENIRKFLGQIGDAIKKAFGETFSGIFGKNVGDFSEKLVAFSEKLKLSEDAALGLKQVIKIILTPIRLFLLFIKAIAPYLGAFAMGVGKVVHGFLEFVGAATNAANSAENVEKRTRFMTALGEIFENIGEAIKNFVQRLKDLAEHIKNTEGFQKLSEEFGYLWENIKKFSGNAVEKVIQFFEKLAGIEGTDKSASAIEKIGDALGKAAGKIGEFMEKVRNGENPFKAFFGMFRSSEMEIPSDGIAGVFSRFIEKIKTFFSNLDLKGAFGGLKETFNTGVLSNIDESMQPTKLMDNVKENFKKFADMISGVDWGMVLGNIGKIALVIGAVRMMWGIGDAASSISDFVRRIHGPFLSEKAQKFTALKTFATAVTMLAGALFLVSTIPTGRLIKAGIAIVGLTVMMTIAMNKIGQGGAFTSTRDFKGKSVEKGGNIAAMIAFAASIFVLALAVEKLADIKPQSIVKAEIAILGLVGIMALMNKLGKGDIGTAASMAAFALAINLIIPPILILGNMKTEKLIKAGVALLGFMGTFALISRIAKSNAAGAGSMALMALSMNLLIPPVLVFGNMKTEKLVKAGVALLGFMSALALASKLAQKNLAGAGTMALLALSVNLLIPPMLVFGNMKTEKLVKAGLALVAVMGSMVLATRLAQNAVVGAVSMSIIAIAVNMLIPPMLVFGNMDTEKLIKAGLAVVAIMTSLAVASRIAQSNVAGAGTMLLMAIPLAAVSVALAILATQDWENILAAGVALAAVMLSMSAACKLANGSIAGVINMSLMLIPLLGVAASLALLAKYDWQNLLAAATAISGVMLAMSATMFIMQAIPIAGALNAVIGLGIFVGALTGIIAALGALNKIEGFNELMNGGAEVLGIIGKAIGNFVGGLIGGVATGITSALPKMAMDLSMFGILIKPFILATKMVDASVLEGIAHLAGAVLIITGADLLAGIASFLKGGESPMVSFGKQLCEFAPYFVIFGTMMQMVNPAVVQASANAALALAKFADTIPNSGGLVAKVTGDNSISEFGKELASFGPHLLRYSQSITGINPILIKMSAIAAQSLADFAKTIPNEGGLVAKITGDNSIAMFGEELAAFGPHFKAYSDSILGIRPELIKTSATAAQSLSDFAKTIPNEGGLVAKITGDNSIAMFGAELESFGPHFKAYSDSIVGIRPSLVKTSASAAQALSDFAQTLPNEGGLLAKITGDNSIAAFGEELASFGPHFKDYSDSIEGIKVMNIKMSASAAQALTDFANNIPEGGGFLQKITGDNSVAAFGAELALFGPHFKTYSDSIQDIKPLMIKQSADAAKTLVDFASEIPDNSGLKTLFTDNSLGKFGEQLATFGPYLKTYSDNISEISVMSIKSTGSMIGALAEGVAAACEAKYSKLDDFGKAVEKFGEKLRGYYDEVTGIDLRKVSDVIHTVYDLIDMANSMDVVKPDNMTGFGNALKEMGNNGIEEFLNGFRDSVGDAYSAGSDLVNATVEGASNSSSYDQWYRVGEYAAAGLANGLEFSHHNVYTAGYNLGLTALNAVNWALSVFSPSRKLFETGKYSGEGLKLGLDSMAKVVYSSGENLGNNVLDAVTKPLELVEEMLANDAQFEPVITPVLDLTDVNYGMNQLGGMFGPQTLPISGVGVGINNLDVLKDLAFKMGSFSNDNSDVVAAIGEMRQDIGRLGNAIAGMQVRLDGNALVGEIINPIDEALGFRSEQALRGVR